MSKKRKTKKEKLRTATRRVAVPQISQDQTSQNHQEHEHVSYSVSDIKTSQTVKVAEKITPSTSSLDLTKFIQQDIRKILAASVGIFAFNIVLFALLHLNILKLGFLGY